MTDHPAWRLIVVDNGSVDGTARVAEHPPVDHPGPQQPQPGLHQGLQHRHHRLPAGRGRRPHEQRRHHHRPPLADQAPGLGLRRRPAHPGRGRRPPGRRPGDDPAPGRPDDAAHPHGPADGRLRARRQPVQHHPVGGVGGVRPGVHPPGLPRRHRPPRRGPVRLLRRLRLLPAGHPGRAGTWSARAPSRASTTRARRPRRTRSTSGRSTASPARSSPASGPSAWSTTATTWRWRGTRWSTSPWATASRAATS